MKFAALLLIAGAALAQDERRVVSPDGNVEFRLFINGSQPDNNLSRVAYQVRYRGSLVVDTSYLGFDLYTQEPILGENMGLISDRRGPGSLLARYMQNGSLARRLDVEVLVFNEGVAFRCTIGKSAGVERIMIADETTEFDLAHDPKAALLLPFLAEQKGIGWAAVTEIPQPGFPRMTLAHEDGSHILVSRLVRPGGLPDIAYDGAAPLVGPWRAILIAPDRDSLSRSLRSLPAILRSHPQ